MYYRKWAISLAIISIALLLFAPRMYGQQHRDSTLKVPKTPDFTVTGDGSASAWDRAAWTILPLREGAAANYTTQVKILYSDSGIYCLFHCVDSKITATLKEDNSDLWNEDVVEVFFHTDEADPIYFEYELSPLNYELPILVPNLGGKYLGWSPWHYEGSRKTIHHVHIDNDKKVAQWTAEFFIPYALLRPLRNVPPQSGTRWRANFYRIDYDNGNTEWSWQQTRINFHDFAMFGTLVFE